MSASVMVATGDGPGWAERVVERVGPIVVKEVRQALRGRLFGLLFGAGVVASWFICLAAAVWLQRDDEPIGLKVLFAEGVALSIVFHIALPNVAYRSVIREQTSSTWVLLSLTGLSAWRIVFEKWLTVMIQAALFLCAFSPFLLFVYALEGVSLADIVGVLVLVLLLSASTCAVGVGLATMTKTRNGRWLTSVMLTLLSCAVNILLVTMLGLRGVGRGQLESTSLGVWLVLCGVSVMTTHLALRGGTAALALPTEHATAAAKRALTRWVVAAMAVSAVSSRLPAGRPAGELLVSFAQMVLFTFGVLAVSERASPSRRSHPASFWDPGVGAGVVLYFALQVPLCLVASFVHLGDTWFIAAHGVAILTWSLSLGRLVPLRLLGWSVGTRVAIVGMTIVSPLVIGNSMVVGVFALTGMIAAFLALTVPRGDVR